jgi:hypothetical protein
MAIRCTDTPRARNCLPASTLGACGLEGVACHIGWCDLPHIGCCGPSAPDTDAVAAPETARRMSAPLLGVLSALLSCVGLAFAAANPRRPLTNSRRRMRRASLACALFLVAAPGVTLAVTAQPVAFFIWIGATAIFGWTTAAILSLLRAAAPPASRRLPISSDSFDQP